MEIASVRGATGVFDSISEVSLDEFDRLSEHAEELNARSMELTDAWGAMFVLQSDTVREVARAMDCSAAVCDGYYEAVRQVADVRQRTTASREGPRKFTWHAFPGSLFILRGITDLTKAMASIDDASLRLFLDQRGEMLDRVWGAQPDYAKDLLFSPEVAARVLAVFGASATAGGLLEVALERGAACAEDAEGRVGMASGMIRSIALVIAAEHRAG